MVHVVAVGSDGELKCYCVMNIDGWGIFSQVYLFTYAYH